MTDATDLRLITLPIGLTANMRRTAILSRVEYRLGARGEWRRAPSRLAH